MGLHIPSETAFRDLGSHLHQARVRHQVPQEFLAHWIGVNRSAIQRIESGHPRMAVAHLAAIGTALALRPGSAFEVLAGGSHRSRMSTLVDPSEATTLCGHDLCCI